MGEHGEEPGQSEVGRGGPKPFKLPFVKTPRGIFKILWPKLDLRYLKSEPAELHTKDIGSLRSKWLSGSWQTRKGDLIVGDPLEIVPTREVREVAAAVNAGVPDV